MAKGEWRSKAYGSKPPGLRHSGSVKALIAIEGRQARGKKHEAGRFQALLTLVGHLAAIQTGDAGDA